MVKISDLIDEKIAAGEKFVAFEYSPPRTEQGVENLHARLERVTKKHDPLYVDFTWGAGGSTADVTLELTVAAKKKYGVEPNMHLTCTNMDATLIDNALEGAKEAGIQNILALRGDPPAGQEAWSATDRSFTCALDLVRYIKKMYGDYFCVSVAGYPEGHPTAIKPVQPGYKLSASEELRKLETEDGVFVCHDEDFAKEMEYLKSKVDAGASMIVTQMFFDVSVFLAFVDECRNYGINCPIMPGLMCIQSYPAIMKMTKFCKSRVPRAVLDTLDKVKDNDRAVKEYGVQLGTEMCETLLSSGKVHGIHFYTMNLEKVVDGIIENINHAFLTQKGGLQTPEEPLSMAA